MEWKLFDISCFEEYLAQWDEINMNASKSPLLDSRFIKPLLDNFKPERRSLLAVAYKKDTVVAITIVEKTRFGCWTTFQPSQSPFGIWIHDPTCSVELLLTRLAKILPGIVLNIGVTQQDPDIAPAPDDGNNLSVLDYIKTARITVNGTFDEYWTKRGRNLRQNMNKQRNRLNKENIVTSLVEINTFDQIHDGVIAYAEIESKGWKSSQGTAVGVNNAQGKFYRDMLQMFSKSGNCRIFQYLYNDDVVATDLCVDNGSTFIILKTTYDENYTKTSPALLMRKEYFEDFFTNKKFKKIEFYGKVMPWHTKWTDEIRKMYHLNYYTSSIIKKIRA